MIIGFNQSVFSYRPDAIVDTTEVHDSILRRFVVTVNLDTGGAHSVQARFCSKGFECNELRRARAANPPGLFQHPASATAIVADDERDIVVTS